MRAEWKYGMSKESRNSALTLSPKQYHCISFFYHFAHPFFDCDISSWNYSPLPVSREKIERDCDGKLISFQMHWRRYQKIILSNLDYIWFVENAEWISKMFFPQHCSLSVVGSIVNREPFMSNENFSSKMKLSVYYYVIPRDMHT